MEKLINKLKTEEGFSLAELLIAMAIFGIILGMSSQILVNIVRISADIGQSIDVTQEAGFITEQLKRGLRSATDVTSARTLGINNSFGGTLPNPIGDEAIVDVVADIQFRRNDDTWNLYQLIRYKNQADNPCPSYADYSQDVLDRHGIIDSTESLKIRVYEADDEPSGTPLSWQPKFVIPGNVCFRYDETEKLVAFLCNCWNLSLFKRN